MLLDHVIILIAPGLINQLTNNHINLLIRPFSLLMYLTHQLTEHIRHLTEYIKLLIRQLADLISKTIGETQVVQATTDMIMHGIIT